MDNHRQNNGATEPSGAGRRQVEEEPVGDRVHRSNMVGGGRADEDGRGNIGAFAPKSPPAPEPSSSSAARPATVSSHISTLQSLDRQYSSLLSAEEKIELCLHRLQQEEAVLRLALEQSSTSLKEQRERESKRRDEEAVARLEEALMLGGNSGDDESMAAV